MTRLRQSSSPEPTTGEVGTRGPRRLGRTATVGIADAAMSSLGNLGLSLCGARYLTPEDFGLLAVAMATAIIIVGLSRVLLVDAFTLGYAGADSVVQATTVRRVFGTVVALAVPAALLTVGIGWWIGGATGQLLVVLGVVLPALIVQEAARGIAYAMSESSIALLNTMAWTLVTLLGTAVLLTTGHFSSSTALLVWGFGSLSGVFVFLWRSGVRASFHGIRNWLAEARSVGGRSGVDYTLNQAIGLGGGLLIAAIAGSAEFGYLRIAQLPFAPAQIVVTGCIAFLQPVMVIHVARGDARTARRLAAGAAVAITSVVATSTAVLMLAPTPLVEGVLGGGWVEAQRYLPVAATALAASAIAATFGPYLRAVGCLTFEVVVKSLVAPLTLLAILFLAQTGDGVPAAAAQAGGLILIAGCALARSLDRRTVPTYREARP